VDVAALGMVTVMSESGAGVVWKTDREQGSLMMTVKAAEAVTPSTTADSVMAQVFTFDNVALFIVTTPLMLSALFVVVTNVKDGDRVQVGF